MQLFQKFLLAACLYLTNAADTRQYHYNPPAQPFVTPARHLPLTIQPPQPPGREAFYVVKPLGSKGYAVQNSQRIFEARLQSAPYTPHLNPLTHAPQHHQKVATVYITKAPAITPNYQQQHNHPYQQFGGYNSGSNVHYNAVGPYGGASGGHVAQHGAASLSGQINGYNAQSSAGQLDQYAHKQQFPGDTRNFMRVVTICQPNGNCEKNTLGPGQGDPVQNQVLVGARAHVAPVSDKCKRIAAAAAANSLDYIPSGHSNGHVDEIHNRPQNRRYYPYKEVPVPQDPYN